MALKGNTHDWAGFEASGATSSSLLDRVKAREPDAWRQLVGLYGPLIYRWCRQAGLSPEDSADVVQEVFASVAKSLNDFRGSQQCGSFRASLRTITQHRTSDLFRDRRGEAPAAGGTAAQQALLNIPGAADASTATEPAVARDAFWRRALAAVQDEFEDRTWQAFYRIVVDSTPPVEVGEELGMSLCAVYQAKSPVLSRLRQRFGNMEGDH